MSDEFGTVNYKRGDRAREIEILRQHYSHHRETIVGLMGDAPTEHLAAEYQRLLHDIDASIAKIAELEGRPSSPASAAVPPSTAAAVPRSAASAGVPPPPAMRPLARTNAYDPEITQHDYVPPTTGDANPKSRMALMIVAGLVVLALIGWLIWRASSDRAPEGQIVDAPVTETAADDTADGTIAPVGGNNVPVADMSEISVSPPSVNYGPIRKGTRAVRQFEVTNLTETPMTITLSRSACRCLFYDYSGLVPPKGKETVTVTVDGARAKAGALRETVTVASKKDPAVKTTFEVNAAIQ